MRVPLCVLAVCLLMSIGALQAGAERVVVWQEDFEGAVPGWIEQTGICRGLGTHRENVHFVGVTDEHAASGTHSLKIDLTLEGYGLDFFLPLPRPVLLQAHPVVQFKLWSGGTQMVPRMRYRSGPYFDRFRYIRGHRVRTEGEWELWEIDTSTVEVIPPTGYVSDFVLYAYHDYVDEQGRNIVWLDDIRVTADLPEGYQRQLYRVMTQVRLEEEKRQQEARKALRQRCSRLVKEFQSVLARYDSRSSPGDLEGTIAQLQARVEDYCAGLVPQAREYLQRATTDPLDEQVVSWLEEHHRLLRRAVNVLVGLSSYPVKWRKLPYWIGTHDPTLRDRVLPDSFPPVAAPAGELSVAACRGEYEPVSLVVETSVKLEGVMVEVSDLLGPDASIPAQAVDVRWVKRWWQAGYSLGETNKPQLVPELLLKDDDFVTVSPDIKSHQNTLKNPEAPRDAKILQPCTIPAGSNKQIWLTVHVPDDTPPGTYRGTVTVSFANAEELAVPLTLRVYPFELADTYLDYAIYHRGRITDDLSPPPLYSKAKSPRQYELELRDIKQHGIRLPGICTSFGRNPDGTYDFSRLRIEMEIRKRVGLMDGPIWLMNTPVDFRGVVAAKDEAARQEVIAKSLEAYRAWEEFRKQNGYPEAMFYAIDEADMQTLIKERPLMKALHEAGGKIAVAASTGYFPYVGQYLDCAIIAHYPQISEMRASQALGHRVWVYARPQLGVEDPEVYRRNYGLLVWQRGEDGVCSYAYQDTMPEHAPNPYDDFDDPRYRDHVMAYPTVDGVIDTVQWEGFREAVDDTRYLTTLLDAINQAKAEPKASQLGQQAEQWLESVDIEGDLTAIRREMAKWIIRLQAATGQ